jgi:hypothetical protein
MSTRKSLNFINRTTPHSIHKTDSLKNIKICEYRSLLRKKQSVHLQIKVSENEHYLNGKTIDNILRPFIIYPSFGGNSAPHIADPVSVLKNKSLCRD